MAAGPIISVMDLTSGSWSSAVGEQLMLTVTVAAGEVAAPSLVVKVKEPWVGAHALRLGVNVTVAESEFGAPGVQGLLVMGPREPLTATPVAKAVLRRSRGQSRRG